MFTKKLARSIMVSAVIIFWNLSASSFADEKTGDSELSKALTQVKLFSNLSDQERDELKSVAKLRHAKAGERIIEEGKKLDRMFIAMDGQTEVWLKGKCIVKYTGQALVGEFEFLDKTSATADVTLTKETDVIELDYAALEALMEKQPWLGCRLMREIAKTEIQRLRDNDSRSK